MATATTESSTTSPIRIAVVVSTTRQPRACPQVARFTLDTISTLIPSTAAKLYELHTLDLLEHPLPFHDEPAVPSQIDDPAKYVHEHTRAWSALISSFDAFVFVTPQYNWGYPAVLKNAIDYLYNEWKGKPAMVVSYGGHGGGKSNAQLREVLSGVRMDVVEKGVELAFAGRQGTVIASQGRDMGMDGKSGEGLWADKRGEISEVFGQLLGKCDKSAGK
jgi:NAD(P)H-dependent FMN reductase